MQSAIPDAFSFQWVNHPYEQAVGAAGLTRVTDGLFRLATLNVSAYLLDAGAGDWVLVDAGMPGFAHHFFNAADRLFNGRPPRAIVLTHGHFDHIGSLKTLLRRWDVPVYAHPEEMPYLTGRSDYPPPDPTVGGFESQMSRLYPKSGIDISDHVRPLPEDGGVPHLSQWQWLATPGHTVGHVSLFREMDRVLVAGDAIITVDQDHAASFFLRPPTLHGPPVYFTSHWREAAESIHRLAELRPRVLVTGHGQAVAQPDLPDHLQAFAAAFHSPAHGRYVGHPPVQDAQRGVIELPPAPPDPGKWMLLADWPPPASWRRCCADDAAEYTHLIAPVGPGPSSLQVNRPAIQGERILPNPATGAGVDHRLTHIQAQINTDAGEGAGGEGRVQI